MHSILILYRSLILAPEAPDSTSGPDQGGGGRGGVGEAVVDNSTYATETEGQFIDVAAHSAKTTDASVHVDDGNEQDPSRTQPSTPGGAEWAAAQTSTGGEPTAAEKHEAAENPAAAAATGVIRGIGGENSWGLEGEASTVGVDGSPAESGIFDTEMMTSDQQLDTLNVVGQLETEVGV